MEKVTLAFSLIIIGLYIMVVGVRGAFGVALGSVLSPDQMQIVGDS